MYIYIVFLNSRQAIYYRHIQQTKRNMTLTNSGLLITLLALCQQEC